MPHLDRTLKTTFNDVAELYDRVRPHYPDQVFEDLTALTNLGPGAEILEIGCGTGRATLPLAQRGFRITCVELGEHLAAVARRNLATYPQGQHRDITLRDVGRWGQNLRSRARRDLLGLDRPGSPMS